MTKKPIEICAFLCIAVGICIPFIVRWLVVGGTSEYTTLATVGDWLGGTSAPLFSLAGFLMMYGAYKMQQEDLRLTRQEMQQTREEFKTQNVTLKRQEFETTFFHLLELHHQIVDSILYQNGPKNLCRGRQYISLAYEGLRQFFGEYYSRYSIHPVTNEFVHEQSSISCMQKALSNDFPDIERNIGHYFKNIFQILRLLDKSILKTEDKMDFAKLLAAQLSNDELHLLFYHCIYNGEDIEFRDLVCRYKIFDTMEKDTLLNKDHAHLLDL